MAYNIYTFNSLDTMYDTLVGILHVLNYSDYLGVFSTVAIIVVVIGAITCFKTKMPPLAFFGSALIFPAILYAIIFSSRVDVNIIDDYTGLAETVDDVPLGLALPLVACTSMEKILLDVIEDKIEKPSVPSFSKVGYFGDLIGINYLNKELIIDDFNLLNTISAYTENCVYHSATKSSEIVRSPDLLSSISTPYDIYFTPVYDANGNNTIKTCSAAYSDIQTMVWGFADSNTNGSAISKIGNNFGEIGEVVSNARSIMDSIAGASFPAYQATSTGLLEQSVLINGLYNGLTGGGSSELLSYVQGANMMGTASAERSSLISATLYIKHLPDLVMYLKVLIVGLFPLVGCFFIAANGKPFLYWSGSLVWISSFLPLTALMHALYAPSVMGDLNILTGGYNWANQAQIQKIVDDALYTAAILVLTLPTLLGMILGWVAPRMMASALMFGRQLGGRGGVGDVKTPENYAKQKMEDQTLQAFSATGDEFNTMTSSLSGRLGEGQHYQSSMNQAFKTRQDEINIAASEIAQGVGGLKYSSGITGAESKQYGQELSASKQEVTSALNNLGQTLRNARSEDTRMQAVSSLMNNQSFLKAIQETESYSETKSFVEDFLKQEGLTSKDSAKIASALTASAWTGANTGDSLIGTFTGADAGFEVRGSGITETAATEERTQAVLQKMSDAYENKFGHTHSDSETNSNGTVSSDGTTKSSGTGYTTAEDISHAVNRLNNASENYSNLEKLNDLHSKTTQYATASEIDATKMLAQMDEKSMYALQQTINADSSLQGNFQNFVNADHNDIDDERMALVEDLRAMKGTHEAADSLGVMATVARANGNQNAYNMANTASMYERSIAVENDYYDTKQQSANMQTASNLDKTVDEKIEKTKSLQQPVNDHSDNVYAGSISKLEKTSPVSKVTAKEVSAAAKKEYDIPDSIRRPTEDLKNYNPDDPSTFREYSYIEGKQIDARNQRLSKYYNEVSSQNNASANAGTLENVEGVLSRATETGLKNGKDYISNFTGASSSGSGYSLVGRGGGSGNRSGNSNETVPSSYTPDNPNPSTPNNAKKDAPELKPSPIRN